ncbi:ATP-dependent DNA helicase chl1 [Dinochytrium kinnereticum]|nr:ATP-dependent DNA helicase chl1 [Dinochytrium kinnereticum]
MTSFTDRIHNSVKDIEDLVLLGKSRSICPYYGARSAVPSSEVVTVPYNIILQKSSRESYKINLKNSVVIFDEAHNLVDAISNAYNVSIPLVEKAGQCLEAYISKFRSYFRGRNLIYVQQLKSLVTSLITQLQQWTDKNEFYTSSEFLQSIDMDNINLFKLSTYLQRSKIAYKIQSFSDSFAKKVAPLNGKVGVTTDGKVNIDTIDPPLTFPSNEIDNGAIHVKYLLLNPLDVFQEIVTESRSVILAGGTMEPIGDFIDQIVTDFVQLDNLRETIKSICEVVPAGVVCFVASYSFLDVVLKHLRAEGGEGYVGGKKIFTEPKTTSEGSGGAIIFCVVGGKLSEGINFSDDLARAVIMIGLPFPNKTSPEFMLRAKFMESKVGTHDFFHLLPLTSQSTRNIALQKNS